jgi:ribosomal protein S13
MNNLLNNDLDLICLISGIVCLTTGYFIKSYFETTIIQTPNSPPTFNLTHEQIQELEDILDKGEKLDKETKNKLDQDFKNILENKCYENIIISKYFRRQC